MNRIVIVLGILILISGASAEFINGKIVDAYGEGINEVVVDAKESIPFSCTNGTCPSSYAFPDTTDVNGNFELGIFPPYYLITYNITLEKDYYESKKILITLDNSSENISLGDIVLVGYGTVKGKVVDFDNEGGIEDAEVTIGGMGYETESNGRFLIDGVSAKTHIIKIEHDDYEIHTMVYDVKSGEEDYENDLGTIKLMKSLSNEDFAVSAYTNYPSLMIGPDETKDFEIIVKNVGRKDATFDISLDEMEEGWKYRVLNSEDDEIDKIFVKSGGTVSVYVEVKSPDDAGKGEHKFKVKISGGNTEELELVADVGESTGKYGFSASSRYRGKAVASGKEVSFEISLVNNDSDDIYKLNASVPEEWKYWIESNGGDEITEVEVLDDDSITLFFRLEPPLDAEEGIYEPGLMITSVKGKETKTLIFLATVRLERELYDVEISSPFSKKSVMIGESIEYSINIQNDGRKGENYNLIVENLPSEWEYKFKEASGNAPQISSVEVDVEETKNVVLQVTPASEVEIGEYPFKIKVSGNANDTLNATLEIEGSHEMKLEIDTLWIKAGAGTKKQVTVKVQNTGLSELRDVEIDVTGPDEWDITAAPSKITSLKPQMTEKFTLNIEPSADTGIDDYKVIVKAKSQKFETGEDVIRVTVEKSSYSGYLGFAMIGAAIIFLIIIFRKFGRK